MNKCVNINSAAYVVVFPSVFRFIIVNMDLSEAVKNLEKRVDEAEKRLENHDKVLNYIMASMRRRSVVIRKLPIVCYIVLSIAVFNNNFNKILSQKLTVSCNSK